MANSKISALTAKTSFADTDEFALVDNAGTPATKKITGANLKLSVLAALRNIARVEKTTHTQYNTTIPLDNTIPQSGEGSEIFTVSHTPTSASNYIRVRAQINFSQDAGAASLITAALFKDAGANAVAAANAYAGVIGNWDGQITLDYRVLAGSTSAATWKIRVGSSTGSNFTVSGRTNAGLYGGVNISSLTVSEEVA